MNDALPLFFIRSLIELINSSFVNGALCNISWRNLSDAVIVLQVLSTPTAMAGVQ